MRSWSISELDNVIKALHPLLGARLQEVKTTERDVLLGFYFEGELLWLWFDLNALRPSVLPWPNLPVSVASRKSPLQLFLRAHFVGRPLLGVERMVEWGRVIRLSFGDEHSLEARLFPHGTNLLAWAGEKGISWKKPAEMQPPAEVEPTRVLRDLEQMRAEWLTMRGGGRDVGKKRPSSDPSVKIRGDLSKRQKALRKVEDEISRKQELPWREVGVWLKVNQNLNVPSEWSPFVDKRRKLAWNIDECFQKAREIEGKLHGTEQRRASLLCEIEELEARLLKPQPIDVAKPILQPLRRGDADARSFRVNDEVIAFAGKNAADNLKLLRKARPWDFWLHLRDQPGAHGVLFRNRSTAISDAMFREVIAWFVKIQFGAKLARHTKERVPVVVAECRYVRPIKGDRLGRATYTHERILIHQVP